ncbi:MATE family efflux transporter [Streptococcus suis]|nr:MATE family efflux transporter [Streptococcus suis]HEL9644278.1 MATE family efflux transporter [Streptococcus suis]
MKETYKDLLKIALPAMAENMLQMIMGMVDSYLVAFLGLVALSGVSVASNIMAIYQAIFIALAAAVASLLAHAVGQGDQKGISRAAGEALKLTILLSLILGLLSIVFGQSLLSLLGTELAVAQAGGLYLAIVGGGILFLGLMTSLGAILRATGRTQLPMYISLLSNFLNAVLSALAVFVLDWGIAGVAIGTVLSRLIACLILWRSLGMSLPPLNLHLDRKLLALALPATGERLMMRAGDVVVVGLITGLGTAVLAGNAIGETLTQFNYTPALGLATATVILTAKAQGQSEKINSLRKASLVLTTGLMVVIALGIYLAGPLLIGIYTQDSVASQASMTVLTFSLVGVPFTAGTLIYTALWQGLGNAKLPFYATSFGMWCVRILVAHLLLTFTDVGFVAIWIGTVLDNVFRAGFLAWFYARRQR